LPSAVASVVDNKIVPTVVSLNIESFVCQLRKCLSILIVLLWPRYAAGIWAQGDSTADEAKVLAVHLFNACVAVRTVPALPGKTKY